MLQEPTPQTVDIGTGIAMAFGKALGKVFVFGMSILASAPAIATMLLLFAGTRWPSFGRSIIANAIGGVVLTALVALGLLFGVAPINNALGGYDTFYSVMFLTAVALIVIALALQIRARVSFSWARAVGIATAILTPFALPYLLRQQ